MAIDEKESWLQMAESCCSLGEFNKMRACGQEILDLNEIDADGMALIAEASLYLAAAGDEESMAIAKSYAEKLQAEAPANPRGLLVMAELYWSEFQLDKAIPAFQKFLSAAEEMNGILERGLSFYADACVLAGEAKEAAKAAFKASEITKDIEKKAVFHSKGLFLSNYRKMPLEKFKQMHEEYDKLLGIQNQFSHNVEKRSRKHNLRIGYISPDFRQHAAAYFFAPFFKYADRTEFKVYAYHTGKADGITNSFKKIVENWRSMNGKTPQQIARKIFDDRIDILVDLSGHSQGSCLPVLAYKPAPVQLSAIGYINTTGMKAVDYFLSDEVCVPAEDEGRYFTEKILQLKECHLCYAPEFMRDTRMNIQEAPFKKNGYITFGSFNNFLKVTEDVLLCWRNILEQVPNSKLVIKSKICSIPSGREIVMERCRRVSINLKQVELRPYSPDYLQQYNDIDIALDSWPYTGGTTTCDAIYMGVPVIACLGQTHGARYSASILAAAGLKDYVAVNDSDYVTKAVKLASNEDLLESLHHDLPSMVRKSRLMDGRAYMEALEEMYRDIWHEYCKQIK